MNRVLLLWVGGVLAIAFSVVCVPKVTKRFVGGETGRGIWFDTVSRYALHTGLGLLGLWLVTLARG